MTTGELTAAIVLDGVRAMSAAQRSEFRALLDLNSTQHDDHPDEWMATRKAAAYLGITANALHKLTAARRVPFEQNGPRCKCWFRRSALDAYRRGAGSVGGSQAE